MSIDTLRSYLPGGPYPAKSVENWLENEIGIPIIRMPHGKAWVSWHWLGAMLLERLRPGCPVLYAPGLPVHDNYRPLADPVMDAIPLVRWAIVATTLRAATADDVLKLLHFLLEPGEGLGALLPLKLRRESGLVKEKTR